MFRNVSYVLTAVAFLAACDEPSTGVRTPLDDATVESAAALIVPVEPQRIKWRFKLNGDYWNFRWGNGQTSGTRSTAGSLTRTRTYNTAGTFNIKLRVTDARGALGISNTITVRVQ